MAQTFKQLGISGDLIKGLLELGIEHPTKVQAEVIPVLMEGDRDLIVQAQTGTGKTAAFGLPLLTKVDAKNPDIQAVIVAPTRELAKQIGKHLFKYIKYADKTFIEVLCGGDKMDMQIQRLKRPTQIIVVTPGRLVDLMKRKALKLSGVNYLILDEADEMLTMGFKDEIFQIIEWVENRKATWLFSATFPESVNYLMKQGFKGEPKTIKVDEAFVVNRNISHRFAFCGRGDKTDFIAEFLKRQKEKRGVIFCRTKANAFDLGKQLADRGFPVDVLQGDLTQQERDKVMRKFKKERIQFLIATDVASRGIDIEGLAFVLHHQIPDQSESYTHRSGRTARAGKKGLSVVLIDPREERRLAKIGNELGISFTKL